MEFSSEFKFQAPIHYLITSDEFVAAIDNETNIRIADKESGKQLKIQPFNQPVEFGYFSGNSACKNGKYLALYIPEKISTNLYQYNDSAMEYQLVCQLRWCEAATEVSIFSNDGKLLATGGNDGRIAVYSTESGRLTATAPRHNEYISAMAFSADASLLAYTSFKKQLTIFDLERNTTLSGFACKEVVATMAFMHKASFLLVGTRENKIFLFDTVNGYIAKEITTTINWPVAIYVDSDDQFAFVSDRAGYLYLIDLNSFTANEEPIFSSKVMIVEIKEHNKTVYFVFEDGTIKSIDLLAQKERLDEIIATDGMAAAYLLMQNDPILKYSAANMVGEMDEKFAEAFPKAVLQVAQGKNDPARDTMGDLLGYDAYKKQFDGVIRHASKVVTFWQLMQSGQYQEAYTMANEGDFFKRLPLFKMMEERFNERFKTAVKALNSGEADVKKVREDLAQFSRVPHKEGVIRNMIKNPEIFNKAQNVFERGDYKELAVMIEKFKMLRGAPAVVQYQELIGKKEEEFLALMSAGRFEEAFEVASFLEENAKTTAVTLKIEFDRLEVVREFIEIVEGKEYGKAMEMALANPYLISTKAYKTLENILSIRFKAAHIYAIKNAFAEMDKLIRGLLKNSFSRFRAVATYKVLYLEQIDQLGKKMQEKHWINALKNYVVRFGVDSEIEMVARRYDQERLLEKLKEFKNPNFLRYPIIPNIVTTPFAKPSK